MAKQDDNVRLANEVRAELRRNAFLDPLAVQVFADNGVVTLTGSVDSELTRQAAEDAARLIVGVTDVRNELTLMGPESSARSDQDLENEVRAQIASDPTLEQPERFHVRARFGHVYISGIAESEEERESLILAAQRVPGVEGVEDRTELRVPIIEGP